MKTAERYKKLTIREITKAAEVYETDHAGIYEMCKDDYPYIEKELSHINYQELLGSNTDAVYSDYKVAYTQIAKLYNMSYDSAKYDLIYADEDDIPELVIEHNCTTSLYTCGHRRLMTTRQLEKLSVDLYRLFIKERLESYLGTITGVRPYLTSPVSVERYQEYATY